jgi:glutathione S-transferase
MIGLEELSVPFDTRLVRFMKGEHRSVEYLKLNPKGKVPVLVVDGEALSENIAILTYLARAYPEAQLLPLGRGAIEDARVLSLLSWCASGLHPIVTRLRLPQLFCDAPGHIDRVWHLAAEAMKPNFAAIEALLTHREWILGHWSLVDAYVYWVWFRATGAGFDERGYPRFAEHAQRVMQRPSTQRVLARDAEAEEQLSREGLSVNFASYKPVGRG